MGEMAHKTAKRAYNDSRLKSIRGVLVLVSLEMFAGFVAGSSESLPVVLVPVDGGYQLQVAGSVLCTARGSVRVFASLDSAIRFCVAKVAPLCKRPFLLQCRVDSGQLF